MSRTVFTRNGGIGRGLRLPLAGALGIVALAVSALALRAAGAAEEDLPAPSHPAPAAELTDIRPHPVPQPDEAAVRAAIDRGIAFLLRRQNKSGSWGSADASRPEEVYAPVPGAHQGFQAATTSLCIAALIETGGDRPDVSAAIDRGEAWLMEHLPHVRRATPDTIYNIWAHCYSIVALTKLLDRNAEDAERAARIKAMIASQIDRLERYEVVDGGWGYYDFVAGTQKPAGSSMSFVTATGLIALHDAKQRGIEVPAKLVARAMAAERRQRKPDFTYLYGEYLKYRPMHPVNRPGGSLGRSQACNLAMRLWGDETVTDEVLKVWLDRIFARNLWLDLARKRPIPHESWFSVAGYFFYYGHYYAGLCIEQLPENERPFYQDHLAEVLLKLQEKDGSWWDFPMYDYHQQYGTAFALMALKRSLRPQE